MIDSRPLRGSDGSGNAVAARVNAQRLNGSTVLKVDSVSKWPTTPVIAVIGGVDVNGYLTGNIIEALVQVSGADINIISYQPGYTDPAGGTPANYYAILKQTTGGANLVQDSIAELQNEDILRSSQITVDFVQSGGAWSVVSGLNGAMTAVTAYQAGIRASLAAVVSRAFTASKDTYVDLLRGGTIYAPTFTLVYTEVANGANAPTLAANSLRLAKIVTNATNILPFTANQQAGFDGIGNLIYNTNPNIIAIGYAQITSNFGTASTTGVQITGLSSAVVIPAGNRRIKITVNSLTIVSTGGGTPVVTIWDGPVGTGTQIGQCNGNSGGLGSPVNCTTIQQPAAGAKTYNAGLSTTAGSATFAAQSNAPSFIIVEYI